LLIVLELLQISLMLLLEGLLLLLAGIWVLLLVYGCRLDGLWLYPFVYVAG